MMRNQSQETGGQGFTQSVAAQELTAQKPAAQFATQEVTQESPLYSVSDHLQNFLDEKLFKSRSLSIFGEISVNIARSVTEKLLALAAENDRPITIYISSPGGHVESGDVIYDMIKFIKPPVRMIGTGWVASAATNIYLAAKKENRLSLPNTRYLVHQPSGGSQGDATDIKIQMEQLVKTKARINRIIAHETGRSLAQVERDTDRDYWMNVEEAMAYGIVSRIVRSVAEVGGKRR